MIALPQSPINIYLGIYCVGILHRPRCALDTHTKLHTHIYSRLPQVAAVWPSRKKKKIVVTGSQKVRFLPAARRRSRPCGIIASNTRKISTSNTAYGTALTTSKPQYKGGRMKGHASIPSRDRGVPVM